MLFDLAGNPSPVQGRASITVDRINGDSTRWTWRGLYPALQSLLISEGNDASVTQMNLTADADSVLGTLEVIRAQSLPDGEEELPVDSLELNWYTTEVSMWQSPYFSQMTYEDRMEVIAAVNQFLNPSTDAAVLPPPPFTTRQQEAFGHLVIGDDTYKQQTAVFSWTRAVSQAFATGVNQANMGKVFTPATLQAYISSRGLSFSAMFNISGVNPPTTVPGTAYSLGWYKDDASFNVAANGKGLLREQWKYGVYSNVMYTVI